MGKLSETLLKTLLFGFVYAQNEPTFQVTGCNAEVSYSHNVLGGDP